MGKITQEQRNIYFEKVKEQRAFIDSAASKEKTLLSLLASDESGAGYKRIALADCTLDLSSWYVLVNTLSVSLLGIKNEDYLLDGRKILVRAMRYVEDTVGALLDAPYSEYEAKLEDIKDLDHDSRYRLVRKMGFAIQCYEDAFGENSKYSNSFIEAWGKFAILAKNLLNLRNLVPDLDFSSPARSTVLTHLGLVKSLFQRCADKNRELYELYTHKYDDFKRAIQFLQALRRLNVVLGERDEAETMKKKIDIWAAKLEADHKKAEEGRK